MGSTGALLNRPTQRTKGSDFAPLLREIKSIRPAGAPYRGRTSIAIADQRALLAATWAGPDPARQLVAACCCSPNPLAIFTTRAAFFGHDAGHQQIGRLPQAARR